MKNRYTIGLKEIDGNLYIIGTYNFSSKAKAFEWKSKWDNLDDVTSGRIPKCRVYDYKIRNWIA